MPNLETSGRTTNRDEQTKTLVDTGVSELPTDAGRAAPPRLHYKGTLTVVIESFTRKTELMLFLLRVQL